METILKLSIALVLSAVVVQCVPGHHAPIHDHKGVDYYAVPKYRFGYGVNDHHTGDIKEVTEERNGGWTRGSYSSLHPDGIVRTVNYVSDPVGGYRAEVLNKGWSHHPHQPVKHVPVHGHHGHH